MKPDKWNYVFLVVGFVLFQSIISIYIYLNKPLYEIDPIPIPLQKGRVSTFEFKLDKKCVFFVGIGFRSEQQNSKEHLRQIFGSNPHKSQVPMGIEFHIVQEKYPYVFKIENVNMRQHRNGEDFIEFSYKLIQLSPGKHTLKVFQRDIYKDLSGLQAYFFAEQFQDSRCE